VRTYFIEISYLLASILFIFGLKGMSHPETAKRGMHLAEFGMLMAIIGTLVHLEIVTYTWILAGLAVGSLVGVAMGLWVPMTATNRTLARVWRFRRRPRRNFRVLQTRRTSRHDRDERTRF
jgi:NAD(P) transhydrogenase subunit beta